MISWLKRHVWDPLRQTWEGFQRDDGTLMAAAVAYYAGVSLFPLLMVLISGLGVVLQATEAGRDAQVQVLDTIGQEASPSLRKQVADILTQVETGAAVGGPIGLAGLLIAGMAIFIQFERAFDRIWNIPDDDKQRGILASIKGVLLVRFRAFLMLCSLGLLVLVVFLASMTLRTIEAVASQWLPVPSWAMTMAQLGVGLTVNILVFTLLYRWLPKVEIRWREAFRGGILVAVGWEIGRIVLANVLIGTKYSNAYGVVGSFLAVMLWLYYVSLLLFIGAEYIQTICKNCAERNT